jgi:ABC-type proline/glycine betaine transport system permease subunit
MQGTVYVFIWIVLLLIPAIAAWKRRWWPFSIYVVGCLIFLYSVLKGKDGWDDLADFATLIVVIIPIYIVASIVWFVGYIVNRKKQTEDIDKIVT